MQKQTQPAEPVRKANGSIWDNRFFLGIVSVLAAVLVWMVVSTFLDPQGSFVIKDVSVNYGYQSTIYISKGLDIVDQQAVDNVQVQADGNGTLIGKLSSSDIMVYPVYNGVQGAGKTTSSAKLAKMLGKNRKVLLASLDVYRPAAQEQLEQLARQIGGHSLPIVNGEKPLAITGRALDVAKKGGFDVLILDSAGRLHIDDALMEELQAVKKLASPAETLLVADAMMGQDACNVAREFNEKLGVTGIVLTRIDGSSRAGAALSMRMIAGVPVKYLGTGEKTDEMEEFHADRIAGRILGQGDVVSLVERAIEKVDREEADKMAARMMKGKFDLEDLLSQLRQIQKLGSLGGIMGMIPGLSKFKNQIADAGIGDALIKKQEAIILSMTKAERKNPDIIKASRKKRIAAGSGVEVHDVNKLLKQYEQMASMMKKMGRGGGFGGLASMMKNVPFGKFPGGTGNKFPF